jgi:hypothetical protein
MIKLVWLLVLMAVAWKLATGHWPWQSGAHRRQRIERRRAQALLGVVTGADRQAIIEAHRRHIATVHPDRGGSTELVHEANAARDLLLAGLPRPPAQL